jgi:molybdopterin-guanine dinucleotide biosynthesis protein A
VLLEADKLLAADRRRPVFLYETLRTRRVSPADLMQVDPQLLTLQNLNTPEDYKKALAAAGLSEHSGSGR